MTHLTWKKLLVELRTRANQTKGMWAELESDLEFEYYMAGSTENAVDELDRLRHINSIQPHLDVLKREYIAIERALREEITLVVLDRRCFPQYVDNANGDTSVPRGILIDGGFPSDTEVVFYGSRGAPALPGGSCSVVGKGGKNSDSGFAVVNCFLAHEEDESYV